MKRILLYLFILFFSLSCSNNDKVVASLVKDKVESMTGQEVVRDLLIENDGNQEQLARIFKCSKFTIQRVVSKRTYLTDSALSEFKNLLVSVKVSGKPVLNESDPYYDSWIRSFRFWLNKWIWWGVGAFVLVFAIGFSVGYEGAESGGFTGYINVVLILLFGGGYLVTWICNMIWSFENPAYLLAEKINPIFETLL